MTETELDEIRKRSDYFHAKLVYDDNFGISDCMRAGNDRAALLLELEAMKEQIKLLATANAQFAQFSKQDSIEKDHYWRALKTIADMKGPPYFEATYIALEALRSPSQSNTGDKL